MTDDTKDLRKMALQTACQVLDVYLQAAGSDDQIFVMMFPRRQPGGITVGDISTMTNCPDDKHLGTALMARIEEIFDLDEDEEEEAVH